MFKKLSSLLLASIMVMGICTGCKSDSSTITKIEDLEGKAVGTIGCNAISDGDLLDMLNKFYETEFKEIKAYDSESSVIMALDTGKIDAVILRDFQANVYSKDSDKYKTFSTDSDKTLKGSARMVAANDTEAANDITKINDALAQLKDDGTLDNLKKEYVDDFDFSKNYDSIDMPKFDGAPTYKISISGSMAPLDYIAADGKPTGYSIALLSKISQMLEINFELVTVGVGTDTLELNSNKIDYIFCYTITDGNIDYFKDLTFSDPYYSYEGTAFLVKK